jgi:hypothetical protein
MVRLAHKQPSEEQDMKYLMVYQHQSGPGFGWGNVSVEAPLRPTVKDIRALESELKAATGSDSIVLINLIPLAASE